MGIFPYGIISQTMVLSSNSVSSYVNLNTLFGVVIALAIIVLIMIATYFVNIKPKLMDNTSENSVKENSSVDNTIAKIVEYEEEELISDCELVAVITAAIYASMGDAVPAEGLVVRSIRKSSSKRWMNA